MSLSGTSNNGFNYSLLGLGSKQLQSSLSLVDQAGSSSTGSFSSSLQLCIANFQSQTFGMLLGSNFGKDQASPSSSIESLLADLGVNANKLAQSTGENGLSLTGRNNALFDPESAYQMMSVINNNDITYKAQFSELSQMKSYLGEMRENGESLGKIGAATGNDSIKSQMEEFTDQYNSWVRRFDESMQRGGLLANTQAAEISRYELDQSIKNIFNGASDGLHGLSDLGLTIDANTKLATLDTGKLDTVLAGNKSGAVNALQQFGANFAKSAELLNADGNFIPNRLSNLSRVIEYFANHKIELQSEFGLGNTAKPTGEVAKALAAYSAMSKAA